MKNLNKILKNKKVVIIKKDIRNLKSIQKAFNNVYCVFHLAAIADIVPSIVNPKDYVDTNFGGTINILEAMRINKVKRIVYAASSSCYGLTPSKKLMRNIKYLHFILIHFQKMLESKQFYTGLKCMVSIMSL